METKPIWRSWTVWFNVLAAAYMTAEKAGLIDLIPPKYQTIIVLVGNLLLRLRTDQPVRLTA